MKKLIFTWDPTRTDADFLIEPDKSETPNNAGFFYKYYLTALPSISGKNSIGLGSISIVSLKQEKNERNSLARLMADSPSFEQLPEDFISLIDITSLAQKLFVLLSPNQRKNFVEALNICMTIEDCKKACSIRSSVTNEYVAYKTLFQNVSENRYRKNLVPTSPFPFEDRLDELMLNLEQVVLLPVRTLLFSEIDFKSLPHDLLH